MLENNTDPAPWQNSSSLLTFLLSSDFSGVTGNIKFYQNGDRIPYAFISFIILYIILIAINE